MVEGEQVAPVLPRAERLLHADLRGAVLRPLFVLIFLINDCVVVEVIARDRRSRLFIERAAICKKGIEIVRPIDVEVGALNVVGEGEIEIEGVLLLRAARQLHDGGNIQLDGVERHLFFQIEKELRHDRVFVFVVARALDTAEADGIRLHGL